MEIGSEISLCKFRHLNEPSKTNKIYSVALFRPPTNRNKNLELYLKGLINAARVLKKCLPDWTMRVYYDNSLTNDTFKGDKKLADLYMFRGRTNIIPLIKLSNVQMTVWECPEHFYTKEGYVKNHKGMFGSIMRFHAAFDPTVEYMVSRDADFQPESVKNDAKFIKRWIASGKKNFYYHSPTYIPAHGEHRETMFAGTWGMKGTWGPEIWRELFTVFNNVQARFGYVKSKLLAALQEEIDELNSVEDDIDEESTYEKLQDYLQILKFATKAKEKSKKKATKTTKITRPITNYKLNKKTLKSPIFLGLKELYDVFEVAVLANQPKTTLRDLHKNVTDYIDEYEGEYEAEKEEEISSCESIESLGYFYDHLESLSHTQRLNLLKSAFMCITNSKIHPEVLTALFRLKPKLADVMYKYGIDEVITNDVIKKYIFNIDADENPRNIPISIFYMIQEGLNKIALTPYADILIENPYDNDTLEEYLTYYKAKVGNDYFIVHMTLPGDFVTRVVFELDQQQKYVNYINRVVKKYSGFNTYPQTLHLLGGKLDNIVRFLIELTEQDGKFLSKYLAKMGLDDELIEAIFNVMSYYGINDFEEYLELKTVNFLL